MSTFALPNGIVLDDTAGLTKGLQDRAKELGIPLRVFLATLPTGNQEYVLVEGENVIYASTTAEAVWAKIEMEALSK